MRHEYIPRLSGRPYGPTGPGGCPESAAATSVGWWPAIASLREDTSPARLRRDSLRKKAGLPGRSSPKKAASWRGAKSGAEERTRTSTTLRPQAREPWKFSGPTGAEPRGSARDPITVRLKGILVTADLAQTRPTVVRTTIKRTSRDPASTGSARSPIVDAPVAVSLAPSRGAVSPKPKMSARHAARGASSVDGLHAGRPR